MSESSNDTLTAGPLCPNSVLGNVTTARPPHGVIHSIPLVALIFIIALISNGTILCAVFTSKQFRRSNNYMIGNIAAIGIYRLWMISMLALLKTKRIEITQQIPCKVFGLFYRATHPLEGLTLACISEERSWISRNPWKKVSGRRSLRRIFYVWMASFLIKSPNLVFWNISETCSWDESRNNVRTLFEYSNTKLMWGSYVAWATFLVIDFVLVTVMPTFYLLKELFLLSVSLKFLNLKCLPVTVDEGANNNSVKKLTGEHSRVVRNAVTFTSLFIIDYVPLGLFLVFYQFPQIYLPHSVHSALLYVKPFFYVWGVLHSAMFPLLVIILSANLKKHYQQLMRSCIGWFVDKIIRLVCYIIGN